MKVDADALSRLEGEVPDGLRLQLLEALDNSQLSLSVERMSLGFGVDGIDEACSHSESPNEEIDE